MELMPSNLVKDIPTLYATEHVPLAQKTVHAKLFTPWASWTWFVCEYDPSQRLAWGLVSGFENEWGYFSLDEIEALRGPSGLRVERDINFRPATVAVVTRRERLNVAID